MINTSQIKVNHFRVIGNLQLWKLKDGHGIIYSVPGIDF